MAGRTMKRILSISFSLVILSILFPLSAFAWTVSVGTWVCNPDASVVVPVEIDDAAGLAYAAVRINYDPQVLVCLRVERGGLDEAFDGDFLVKDDGAGTLSFARFRKSDGVASAGGGILARAVFAVRPGTARQYSDLAIANIRLGDDSGVRDLSLSGTIAPSGGMVRIFPENGSAARLEGAQTIAADTHLATLALSAGDAIQASAAGTPIVVSGATSATAEIAVLAPEGGWANGTYALLKTSTRGLSFVSAENGGAPLAVEESEEDGLRLYSLRVETDSTLEIVTEDGTSTLGTAATAYVQGLFAGEEGVTRVVVGGGEKNVLLARALGIRPAEIHAGATIEARFETPTIEILSYDRETSVIKVRVTPGTGNTLETELMTGVVRLRGGAIPGAFDDWTSISFSLDADSYLATATKGEFTLSDVQIDFGPTSFFRLAVSLAP